MVLWRLFHRSQIQRYHTIGPKGEEPWALVTGASDGIGKGVARELLAKGFNVILHGRNTEKLERVKSELLTHTPDRSISFWTWDATQPVGTGGADLSASLTSVIPAETRLVALVNNVGYTSTYQAFAEQESADIDKILHVQAFTMYLTRLLLPRMYAEHKPALVINVAGLTRSYPAPLLAVHSGEKAAIVNWSRALAIEFELAKQPAGADVEVLCVDIHVVASNSNSSEKGFFAPDGTEMGVAIIGCVGCGKRVVTAYWPHEVTAGILKWLPMSFMDSTMAKQLVAMKERETKLAAERAGNGQSA